MDDYFRSQVHQVVEYVAKNNGCTFESVLQRRSEPTDVTARALLKASEMKLINDGRICYERTTEGRIIRHRVNDLLWTNSHTIDYLLGEYDPFTNPAEAATGSNAEPAKPDETTNGGTDKATSRKPSIEDRMLAEMASNLQQVKGWTVRQWADRLDCAISTIADTETWQSLALLRQQMKAEKRNDRKVKRPNKSRE